MKFKKYLLSVAVSTALAGGYAATSMAQVDASKYSTIGNTAVKSQSTGLYIVKMKGPSAITKAVSTGELKPDISLTDKMGNQYNANTPTIESYVRSVKSRQQHVASLVGVDDLIHQYAHTFNGFSAKLSPAQVAALRSHPSVSAVYEDEVHELHTANTPAFLGLTGEGGQHTLGIKGEDVIVGILDSGIWPENPSFGEDPQVDALSYGPPPERWSGSCNTGSIGEFVDADNNVIYNDETVAADEFDCNNKLIGAQYFGSTFSSVYEIQFPLGEFASPRDADGHGSHTASTAAGNAGVQAVLSGTEVGAVSGIAPRARIAAYKVCWNSGYVSPDGVNERGCFFGDSMAAIEKAVLDGVDVLNYSIGNSNNINSPVYNAALKAADAGVFFTASAGNGGPGPETVGNIAPWITTVAASTYDGESALVGNALEVNSGDLAGEELFSIRANIGTQNHEGFTGELGLADDILACEPLTSDLTGKIALISRGACGFVDKMQNAEAAGAIGVVVYTDSRAPIAMGGTDPGIGIPGVMVTTDDGLALAASIANGTTSVTFGAGGAAGSATEVGNIMAGFSSRGQNPQTSDIIKPDITAPGVRILAATSEDQLDIPGNVDGESYAFLQGTSMSAPHVAGMGALLMGQYPDWTPAQVKSALMTTAYQGVVKEDGVTPADPFDFGAGHGNPVEAMNPGLVYSADLNDYLGFLCGQGEDGLVSDTTDGAVTCDSLDPATFDASQLNYPSIAITDLSDEETITRSVTDVTGSGGTYDVIVDAPPGIEVSVDTGNEAGTLEVPANGEATYSLTFSRGDGFVPGEFGFGSVTLSDGEHSVRSPIAISADAVVTIEAPEALDIELNSRGRASYAFRTFYNGSVSIDYNGFTAADQYEGTADRQGPFDFITEIPDSFFFEVEEGATALSFTLGQDDLDTDNAAVDLDLYVYRCEEFSCTQLGFSFNGGTNEEVTLVGIDPADDIDNGTHYILFVSPWSLAGETEVNYSANGWIVDSAENTTRISTSRRAIDGRFNNVRISTRGLDPNETYMGTVTYFDDDGVEQATTLMRVQP